VISDVKQRVTTDGTRVTNFRVASNSRRYDKEAEQWVDGDRLFRIGHVLAEALPVAWDRHCQGDPVVVTGRLYTRGYEIEGPETPDMGRGSLRFVDLVNQHFEAGRCRFPPL